MKAVMLMAHGAPQNPDEVEEYILRIRHGRPLEPAAMASIKDRYIRIGSSPLLHWTQRQAEALQKQLQESGKTERVHFGMRYSHPFIHETVDQMIAEGVQSTVAVCMAPQFSSLTIGAYENALEEAIGERSLQYSLVKSYACHPGLIRAFTARLKEALKEHPNALAVFTAHSLPERVLSQGDPYDFEVKETARLVAREANLKVWKFAYQSQGMTAETWLGPTVESQINGLTAQHHTEILIAPIGFVCDHVEILYDVDIRYREYAEKRGMKLYRTQSLNDSSEFIDLLSTLVLEKL